MHHDLLFGGSGVQDGCLGGPGGHPGGPSGVGAAIPVVLSPGGRVGPPKSLSASGANRDQLQPV